MEKKNLKWTASELLNYLNREADLNDFRELYKAMLALELSINNYDEALDKKLDKILDEEYYDNDDITTFINYELYIKAEEIL